MRKFIATAVMLVLVVCLAACGPSSGTVYAKDAYAAKDWTTSEPTESYQCNYEYGYHYDSFQGKYVYGFYNHCGYVTVGYHDEQHHKDAEYIIRFKNDDGDKGSDSVSKERYETIEIGDFYEK